MAMDGQPSADGIVVFDDNDTRFYTELPSGEALLVARDCGWGLEESKRAHVLRMLKILRLLDPGTSIQKYFSIRFDFLWETYNQIISQRAPSYQSTAPSVSYPPLTSNRSTDSKAILPDANLPIFQLSDHPPASPSFPLITNTTRSTALLSTQEEWDPLVLDSVHKGLTHDSSYTEAIVLKLKKIPVAEREILFNTHHTPSEDDSPTTFSSSDSPTPHPSPADLRVRETYCSTNVEYPPSRNTKYYLEVPGITYAPANSSNSSRQVPHSQSSQAKSGKRKCVKHGEQNSSRGKSNKKAKFTGDADGSDSGGGADSILTDRVRKSKSRWACPYSLAFNCMIEIARFKSCRPPGSLNRRSLWKDHLREYHSPQARLSNPTADHAPFYMDENQWEMVQDRIAKDKIRPRPYDEWFKIQKECFLDVWRIIFPEECHGYNAPLSPFHPDRNLLANTGPPIAILLDTIRKVKADEAVSTGSISDVQDFHPTNDQYMEMMKDALAIVIKMSPGASQWITNVSCEGLQASVADHSNQVASRAEAENASSKSTVSSELSLGSSSGSNSSDDTIDPGVMKIPTVIPLFPLGTQISLQVLPNCLLNLNQQPALLEVNTPLGFFISNMSQAPTFMAAPIVPPSAEFDPDHEFVDPSFLAESTVGQTHYGSLEEL
ncbi:uncharacterized protein GGS22DRAFT_194859 [Annulohypoxylon maeteangense]|uniref:uncharacterized protein n=1 Tax=Annulohypoxylon maeteangense TaxID=1927788 RepID=UPI002007EBD9|nr:uncharacterized protein GGS22DRAFT_194859 [Annulohypoxylon maeteangense]KAI0884335.1 hypothetical protein GGS22DRAFT_194859 [Annulohypoxylon maeteangense]